LGVERKSFVFDRANRATNRDIFGVFVWHARCNRCRSGGISVNTSQGEWGYYRHLAKNKPLLDATLERDLLAKAQAGDRSAARTIVESHLRLVVQVASSYARDGLSVHDLIGEGMLGLLEAMQRFELSKNVRFASYAAFWVRAAVRQHAFANRRIVGMPSTRGARVARARMGAAERGLTQELGRRPSRAELAQALGVSEHDVELVSASLAGQDIRITLEGDTSSYEPHDEAQGPEQALAEAEGEALRKVQVTRALSTLSAREREVVCEHWYSDDTQSLAKLGRSFGVSRQRAGQILAGAREKLRAELSCVA
jgi:RNA polymerase sigma-32 factor